MTVYQVKDSTLEGTHDFGDGTMNQYVLTLVDEGSGETLENVNHWISTNKEPFLEGDRVEGEIKSQNRGGIKLTRGRKAGSSSSSGSSRPSSGGRSDTTGRSIERQVALKAAAEVAAAAISSGQKIPADKIVALAEGFDAFLSGKTPEVVQEAPAAESDKPAVADDDDIPF